MYHHLKTQSSVSLGNTQGGDGEIDAHCMAAELHHQSRVHAPAFSLCVVGLSVCAVGLGVIPAAESWRRILTRSHETQRLKSLFSL